MSNKITRIIIVLVSSAVLLSLTLWLPDIARAGSITVNEFTDRLDNDKGNGSCSLREAIENANNNNGFQVDCNPGSALDTITLLYSGTYTLTLTGDHSLEPTNLYGDLDITDDVIIYGHHLRNTFIQAGTADPTSGACKDCIDRVLDIDDAYVEIFGITIRYGQAHDGSSSGVTISGEKGGGIRNIGGHLKLINSAVNYSKAGDGEPGSHASGGIGGGIFNDGTLELINSRLYGNYAGHGSTGIGYPGEDGGIGGKGGGIYSNPSEVMTCTNSIIDLNHAGDGGTTDDAVDTNAGDAGNGGLGGGIYNGGKITLLESRVNDNYGGKGGSGGDASGSGSLTGGDAGNGGYGGGIFGDNTNGLIIIIDSTIRENWAGLPGSEGSGSGGGPNGTSGFRGPGGGIYLNLGSSMINGSTFSDNHALYGGGIQNQSELVATNSTISNNRAYDVGGGLYTGGSSSTELIFVTITDNTADVDNDGGGDGGGIYRGSGTITLTNTILAGNTDKGGEYPEYSALINSGGYNLIGHCSGTFCDFVPVGTDLVGSSYTPGLEDIDDNGGPTETHALLVGSDALSRIPYNINGCGTTYNQDQRGETRSGPCDIGAFELPFYIFLPLIMR